MSARHLLILSKADGDFGSEAAALPDRRALLAFNRDAQERAAA